ncbi:MAG: polymer-forming cytoskeletal protein [Gammaproteobacteria bacterium]
MFSSKKARTRPIETLVGAGTLVRGDVIFEGGMHLDGRVAGDVSAAGEDAVLTVGEKGVIEGSVTLEHLVLEGTITGDVNVTDRVRLGPTARIEGNLRYNVLEMASGARVNGRLIHDPAPGPGDTSGTAEAEGSAEPGPEVDGASQVS